MSETILIVEDEPDVLDLVAYQLQKAGFTTHGAVDGARGLQRARELAPALIVLDLMLPEMEGTEVCKQLKADAKTAPIPVLILSGKADEIDRVVGFEIGADDYLVKPFNPRELVLRVQAVLGRCRCKPASADIYQAGELVVDRVRRTVIVAGQPLSLTKAEFKLVATLIACQGQVLSREQLLTDVWGYEDHTDSRTVDTHVRRLRGKMGTAASYIETVRSIGYRFTTPI